MIRNFHAETLQREVKRLRSEGVPLAQIDLAVSEAYREPSEPPVGGAIWRDGVLWMRTSTYSYTNGLEARTWGSLLLGCMEILPAEYPVTKKGEA